MHIIIKNSLRALVWVSYLGRTTLLKSHTRHESINIMYYYVLTGNKSDWKQNHKKVWQILNVSNSKQWTWWQWWKAGHGNKRNNGYFFIRRKRQMRRNANPLLITSCNGAFSTAYCRVQFLYAKQNLRHTNHIQNRIMQSYFHGCFGHETSSSEVCSKIVEFSSKIAS